MISAWLRSDMGNSAASLTGGFTAAAAERQLALLRKSQIANDKFQTNSKQISIYKKQRGVD